MLKTTIKHIAGGRFWKKASFSEVGQLYAARMLRTIGINLGAAFMSVFMLKNGYTVLQVSMFWAGYFGLKVVLSLPLAQLVANIGAKKAILTSNFLYIPAMISFMFLPQIGIYAMVITATFQGISAALYDIGYMVSFSRAKSPEKAGKEVALMNISEKVARGLSPLVGGLLAMFFDPRLSILISIIFFVMAARPLMSTKESMDTGFDLAPRGFPWREAMRSLIIQTPVGFDSYASDSAWSLFLASIIFTAGGNQTYAELGALTSLILVVSIASTHMYGKLIDKKAGNSLLFWAGLGNVAINVFRAFTKTPVMAVGTNAANEIATTGYSMAILRGTFDIADRTGYRVFYIGMVQLMTNLGAATAAVLLATIVALLDVHYGFMVFYMITAAVVSLIMLSRFRIYSHS